MTVRIGLSSADRFREERSLEQAQIERLSNRLLHFSKVTSTSTVSSFGLLDFLQPNSLFCLFCLDFDSLGGPWRTPDKDGNSARDLTEPFRILGERRRY